MRRKSAIGLAALTLVVMPRTCVARQGGEACADPSQPREGPRIEVVQVGDPAWLH